MELKEQPQNEAALRTEIKEKVRFTLDTLRIKSIFNIREENFKAFAYS